MQPRNACVVLTGDEASCKQFVFARGLRALVAMRPRVWVLQLSSSLSRIMGCVCVCLARVCVCTGIGHVINMDLPKTFEDYVHRIGRTGRAGTKGGAKLFIIVDCRSTGVGWCHVCLSMTTCQ